MSADPAEKHATYQDVLDAPEGLVAEILGGELFTHPRPAGPHSEAASVLGMDIGGAFHRGRGGPSGVSGLMLPALVSKSSAPRRRSSLRVRSILQSRSFARRSVDWLKQWDPS